MPHDETWEASIRRVLRNANAPLHYTEIAERISSQGIRRDVGANPAATVAAYLSRLLKDGDAEILRLGGGQYAIQNAQAATPSATLAPEDEDELETGALRSFGMFWQREQVSWGAKPKLLGRQNPGSAAVDFAQQIGVYLLHDRERIIYVGRAGDSLFSRLKIHTADRLGGRWDRFSWFGLRDVDEQGRLVDKQVPWSETVVIETLEALLIESLEPPLNRKRGDNLSSAEYLQVLDPTIEGKRFQAYMAKMIGVGEPYS